MKFMEYYKNYFEEIFELLKDHNLENFKKTLSLIKNLNKKNKIIFVGNGGSASIANHCSTDYNKILKKRSMTFNEANLITCYANDYGHDQWMSEAIKTYGDKNDILVLISSSGKSKNIINCGKAAKHKKMKIITFSGFDINNKLKKIGNVNFWVNSKKYNHIEMVHHIWLLSICDHLSKQRI